MVKNEHYLGEKEYDFTLVGVSSNKDQEVNIVVLSKKNKKTIFEFKTSLVVKQISFTVNSGDYSNVDVLILDHKWKLYYVSTRSEFTKSERVIQEFRNGKSDDILMNRA